MGVVFASGHDVELKVYLDYDHARNMDDRRFVTGSAVLCGKSSALWIARTQRRATTSTIEAEYVATAEAVKNAFFVRDALDFSVPGREGECITLYEDNGGALSLTNNLLSSA